MRKPGWYWVRSGADEAWEVAEWSGGTWEVTGTDHDWPEYMIEVVGPRIPTPDEPWQCVPVEPTERMVEAACEEVAPIDREYERSSRRWDWRMMLEAAPKPETQP